MSEIRRRRKRRAVQVRWRRACAAAVVWSIAATLLSGCWDRLEIEERAVVLGIGIDKAELSETKKESNITHVDEAFPKPNLPLIRLTVQIAVPGRIPLGPSDAGGGSKPGQKPVWVLNVVGHTIDDAFMNLQQEVADRLFWGHLRVIVISKEVAEMGLTNINEYLRRNPEVRRTTWMVISDGEAGKLMKLVPQLERVPILYLLNTMDHSVQMGKLPNAFAGTYWSGSSAKGMEPFLPYVRLVGNGSIEIAGLAYFRSDKMVGKTEPLEIGAYMGIKGLHAGGYGVMVKIPGTDTSVLYQVTHRTSRIDVLIRNGKPEFHVKVHNEGNLLEKSNEAVQLNRSVIQQIEKALTVDGKKGYEELIRKTQEKGSDIFGFGEYVRAKKPFYWSKHIRTKQNWEDMYKDVEVKLDVSFNIRRIGGKTR
ncbi:Ger(x)C family spore germination protein [Paenibacillus flagellatus]|uniref:Ger(X)C family spore germination protein n=1 Tax=Paenibacillus flagellatus TaxID=2211139 RepID=A0A2V5KBF4_9BACL|nr:Ger(x)C family spore germination protein [Paenibacillus flagellatus]PYI56879.1 Ger(x)C family spore germination protein [Paenibacillus flagellatus]